MGTRVVLRRQGFIEINAPGGVVNRGVAKAAGQVRDDAKRFVGVDTGALRQDISSRQLAFSASDCSYRVGANMRYSWWHHQGVRGPIVPRRAKALRFKPKGSAVYIFRKSTRGFKGSFFLAKAVAKLRAVHFT